MQTFLSVIVSVRLTEEREDILERLSFAKSHLTESNIENIEHILVDDGSQSDKAAQLKERCTELNISYLSTEASPDSMFNLARARNFGAQQASGRFILFLDADILPYPGFYNDIFKEIELQTLEKRSDLFLMCPVLYFKEETLPAYQQTPDRFKKDFLQNILLEGHMQTIDYVSYGTSCILTDRLYYLSIGGQNTQFEGWGYEDYEFTTRMIALAPLFPHPRHYTHMGGNFMTLRTYEGWKAVYRLYGLWLARKGMFLIHVPHKTQKSYHKNKNKNLKLFKVELSKDWPKEDIQPIIPQQPYAMILAKNPFCLHYKLNSLLGRHDYIDYKKYDTLDALLDIFKQKKFTQIIFPNPYAHPLLKELYDHCRTHKIKYLICERGALPDAIYHDPNGFLSDSSSYHPDKWDQPLTDQEKNALDDYLISLKKGQNTLEHQPERQTDIWKNLGCAAGTQKITDTLPRDGKYEADPYEIGTNFAKISTGLGVSKIIVFLQTENDTVMRYFGKDYGRLAHIKHFCEELINHFGDKISLIYKNHPLEINKINIQNGYCADHIHMNDLIDSADAVIVVNSGTGLIASALGKPVFTLGESWYSSNSIACPIENVNDFIEKFGHFTPDREKIDRFLYYLRFKFYAFGTQKTILHKQPDKHINATYDIHYYEVQTQDHGRLSFKKEEDKISFDSVLFEGYDAASLESYQHVSEVKRSVRQRKWKKFKEQPVTFFIDMFRNLMRKIF
ncbi:MAG: glycosyltransferase [Pseudomonadota bacterium]